MRILHVIHDFLPRHRAGSEIYAFELVRALQERSEDVWVLAAEYELGRKHASLLWREYRGVPVVELINNWVFDSFRDTYQSRELADQLDRVLEVLDPDVVHIHNLLNLSFDLPDLCRKRGIATIATLHDYTIVCPSGGQRVHQAESHVCHEIEAERCATCFKQHNFHARLVYGSLGLPGAAVGAGQRASGRVWSQVRRLAAPAASRVLPRLPAGPAVTPADIEHRLDRAREVFGRVDRWVAPSKALGDEYLRLGMPEDRLEISDYGFVPLPESEPKAQEIAHGRPLRIGFVGTLVWHKGAHVVVDAVRKLEPASYELHLFGARETFPDYVASLEKQADGLPVTFHGGFPEGDAARVYGSFDVLVVSSLWPENSPLVIHEAFQAGVPVVGARIGGIPGLVEDESWGLLYDAFSADDLARALSRLTEEPELLPRLASAVPRVKSIAEDAEQWLARYDRLASSRRTREAPRSVGSSGTGTSAVLLNYKTPHETVFAARALQRSEVPAKEILIVDNGSGDGSVEVLERLAAESGPVPIELVALDRNRGFSGGCNVGIEMALERGADSVLLLNPDAVAPPSLLGELREVLFSDESIGIVGPTVVWRSDPRRVVSAGIDYSPLFGRIRHRLHGSDIDAVVSSQDASCHDPLDVDAVAGCVLLASRSVFERIGTLREDFFFSFEEIELCLRAGAAGLRSVWVPFARAQHEGGVSIGATSSDRYYYAARNHLLLAESLEADGRLPLVRRVSIALLNFLHGSRAGARRPEALAAVREGIRDYRTRRFGKRSAVVLPEQPGGAAVSGEASP